jgi:hypothetical protein
MLPRFRWRVCPAVAVALAVLAGCAGGGQYEKWLNSRIGAPIEKVVEEMGPPHEVKPDAKGNRIFHWSMQEVKSHSASARDSFQYKHPDKKQRKPDYCETRFVVGGDKRVKSWSYRGNDCEPPVS